MLTQLEAVIAAGDFGTQLAIAVVSTLVGVVGSEYVKILFGGSRRASRQRVENKKLMDTERQLGVERARSEKLTKQLFQYRKRRGLTRKAVGLAATLRDAVGVLSTKSSEAANAARELAECLGEPGAQRVTSPESPSSKEASNTNDEGDDDPSPPDSKGAET